MEDGVDRRAVQDELLEMIERNEARDPRCYDASREVSLKVAERLGFDPAIVRKLIHDQDIQT